MKNKSLTNGKRNYIETDKTNIINEQEKESFSKCIRDIIDDYNNDDDHRSEEDIGIRDLANKVGITYEYCRKIINGQKTTKNRDLIIAFGIALERFSDEIGTILRIYNSMPGLDEKNDRDFLIKDTIDSNEIYPTIEQLNSILEEHGYNSLDIKGNESPKNKIITGNISLESSHLKLERFKVSTPVEVNYNLNKQFKNSLRSHYNPFYSYANASIVLKDTKQDKKIQLLTSSVDRELLSITFEPTIKRKRYSSLNTTGRFKELFAVMLSEVQKERQRLLRTLNDTKNYKKRISANFIDDSITFFCEEFNYTMPEVNEYYVMTYSSGEYKLQVFNKSVFMKYYLSKKEYRRLYGSNNPEPTNEYKSIKELESLINKKTNNNIVLLNNIRLDSFKRMKKEIASLRTDIKNGEKFIRRIDDYFEFPGEVIRYYKLENDYNYKCEMIDDYNRKIYFDDSANFELDTGETISITLRELETSFELNIENISDICKTKSKLGSIEKLIT